MTVSDLSVLLRDLAVDTKSLVADYVARAIAERAALDEARFAALQERSLTPGPPGPAGARGEKGDAGHDGLDGKDANEVLIRQLTAQVDVLTVELRELRVRVAELPVPRDGTDGRDGVSVDAATVAALVAAEVAKNADGLKAVVAKALAALPTPRDGKDGKDGVSVDATVMEAMVAKAVKTLPTPRDGKDGVSVDPAVVKAMVADVVAALPLPRDGKDGRDGASVDVADLEPAIAAHVERAVAARPLPKDGANGVGIASAVVDREGRLVLMLTDGTTKDVGTVVGRDGDPEQMRYLVVDTVRSTIAAFPIPKDGKDGTITLGDLVLVQDPENPRRAWLETRDGRRIEGELRIYQVFDRGVYQAGASYDIGDGVTWDGSWWLCQRATTDHPSGDPVDGQTRAWRLAVKHGAPGKPGPRGEKGLDGKDGRPGRDLTQLLPDGTKY